MSEVSSNSQIRAADHGIIACLKQFDDSGALYDYPLKYRKMSGNEIAEHVARITEDRVRMGAGTLCTVILYISPTAKRWHGKDATRPLEDLQQRVRWKISQESTCLVYGMKDLFD